MSHDVRKLLGRAAIDEARAVINDVVVRPLFLDEDGAWREDAEPFQETLGAERLHQA